MLFLAVGVWCTVWSVWQVFTDANRVVSGLIAGVVALAVARPFVTNLVWAISLLFWKPHKWMTSFYEWVLSPQVAKDAAAGTLPPSSTVRELLGRVVQEGAPDDRDAAAEALKSLPADGEPPSVQQVRAA